MNVVPMLGEISTGIVYPVFHIFIAFFFTTYIIMEITSRLKLQDTKSLFVIAFFTSIICTFVVYVSAITDINRNVGILSEDRAKIALSNYEHKSKIRTLNSLTNGLYRIIISEKGPGSKWYAVLQQERVTGIIAAERFFTSAQVDLPRLVVMESQFTRKNSTNVLTVGFVEISDSKTGEGPKLATEYLPFEHLK